MGQIVTNPPFPSHHYHHPMPAYHPPRSHTGLPLVDHIINTADSLKTRLSSSKLIVCGDFNELDVGDILNHLGLRQLVDFPTHGSNTLDLVMIDIADHYLPPQPLPHMGQSILLSVPWSPALTSSHTPVNLLKTNRPTLDSSRRLFGQWAVRYRWAEVLTLVDVVT